MSSMMKLCVVHKQKEFVDFAIKSIIDCSRLNVRYIRIVFIDFELNFFLSTGTYYIMCDACMFAIQAISKIEISDASQGKRKCFKQFNSICLGRVRCNGTLIRINISHRTLIIVDSCAQTFDSLLSDYNDWLWRQIADFELHRRMNKFAVHWANDELVDGISFVRFATIQMLIFKYCNDAIFFQMHVNLYKNAKFACQSVNGIHWRRFVIHFCFSFHHVAAAGRNATHFNWNLIYFDLVIVSHLHN